MCQNRSLRRMRPKGVPRDSTISRMRASSRARFYPGSGNPRISESIRERARSGGTSPEVCRFSRKLHAVLAPLLGGVLLLARRADRAYVKRVRGPNDQGRLRCLDRLWCVCHYTCPMVGARVVGLGCRQIARRDETGRSQTHPCPLTYAAPAVHFQSLLLAEFRCPIENDRDYRQ